MPGRMPPTSQLDWLISTTAMIVLFWSRATRDLLKSFGWGIAALHRLNAATKLPRPRRPPHSVFRFRAFLSLRSSSVFSIPRLRSAEGTDAESGTEDISLKRKESGGLPIAVGGTRSKTGRFPCLHNCWAEQCEPDILLYRSPYKCFPWRK